MKIFSWVLCLGITFSLQASPRNPFMMPFQHCEELLGQLDGWHLKGIIGTSSRYIALMGNPQQATFRVRVGTELITEAKVVAVSIDTVSVSLDRICDGACYHWHLSGGMSDKESNRRIATATAIAQHQSEPSGDADSG